MGSLTLRLPSIQGRTADEKIESLRRSIAGMVDELNLADWSAYSVLSARSWTGAGLSPLRDWRDALIDALVR